MANLKIEKLFSNTIKGFFRWLGEFGLIQLNYQRFFFLVFVFLKLNYKTINNDKYNIFSKRFNFTFFLQFKNRKVFFLSPKKLMMSLMVSLRWDPNIPSKFYYMVEIICYNISSKFYYTIEIICCATKSYFTIWLL